MDAKGERIWLMRKLNFVFLLHYFNDAVSMAGATYFECCEKVVMANQYGRIKKGYDVVYFQVPVEIHLGVGRLFDCWVTYLNS